MITREDLTTQSTDIEMDGTIWHQVVDPSGKKFLLSATNLTEEDLANNPILFMLYLTLPQYMVESAVFRADDNWDIVGECGPQCEQGVCTKRIAEDRSVGSIDRSYQLLLNYLNG